MPVGSLKLNSKALAYGLIRISHLFSASFNEFKCTNVNLYHHSV